jgi:hypothetical protein
MDSFWTNAQWSDDEEEAKEVTFQTASDATMSFGKHRGQTLGSLVKSKAGRSYLAYVQGWDGLYEDQRRNIECVMKEYEAQKKAAASK